MKEAECGTSWGQAHTKQWSSGNLVLIFTLLGMKVDGGGGGVELGREREKKKERRKEAAPQSLRVLRVVNLTV